MISDRWLAWIINIFLILGSGYGLVVACKFGSWRLRGYRALRLALAQRSAPLSPAPGPARITFVCPVTRPVVLQRLLLRGLAELAERVECICYLNRGPSALAAAQLFNRLAPQIKTDYVAFCHQDWRPVDRDWVAKTLEVFATQPACEMVAQIGVAADRASLGGQIVDSHGFKGRAGVFRLHAPDEQCCVIRTHRLRELPFDEAALPEFHFWAVDYAYELQKRGFTVWSTAALGYHHSAIGNLNSRAFKRARRLLRDKYGPGCVRATTGWV
ncbi:MAG: hypothetical protein HY692_09020 [Cyanobacteria bacterium NC_groundwater_1444_Ag_S-0.65um_54_12]|nr:hypothetical protein [Cyanobacteria bacterium NC_groundwater_1444_Ag_S-0.65um_54_12]